MNPGEVAWTVRGEDGKLLRDWMTSPTLDSLCPGPWLWTFLVFPASCCSISCLNSMSFGRPHSALSSLSYSMRQADFYLTNIGVQHTLCFLILCTAGGFFNLKPYSASCCSRQRVKSFLSPVIIAQLSTRFREAIPRTGTFTNGKLITKLE